MTTIHFRLLATVPSEGTSRSFLIESSGYIAHDKSKHPIDEASAKKEAEAQIRQNPTWEIVLLQASHRFKINPEPTVVTTKLVPDEDVPF